jgi:hypothetical protein
MLHYHLDIEELENPITKFCKNPLNNDDYVGDDYAYDSEINTAMSWWEVEKIWLLGAIKDIKLTEFNTFHFANDASYMDRIMRVINTSSRLCKWGYLVHKTCINAYDRDEILSRLTSQQSSGIKFTVPTSAVAKNIDGTNKFSSSNIRGWKNLSTVKFGKNKIHVVTSTPENFIPAIVFALNNMASQGIFIAHVYIDDTIRRYIKLLQSYFSSVQIRTSEWSNTVFICAVGFTKCPKKVCDYMTDNIEELVSKKVVPDIKYEDYYDEYKMTPNQTVDLSTWMGETAF